ncbi:MAG TPA: hypothetical protein ENK06_05120, partial [Gammaproteobacteria bacterium]|nr:hypothetical protein [Gammaproteobacteria bacterium]
MKQAFRLIFEKLRFCYLVTIGAFKLLFYPDSYLHRVGFFYSVGQHKPLNLKREPVPWMNYNAISFLETRLSKSIKIFEYGSGYSTVFYADRASQVTSLEYNKEWLNKIQEMLSGRDNVRLLYKPLEYDGEYCKAILSTREKFDLVIVDGRDRVRCIFNAVDAL